jgi:hypothetical protein
MRPQSPDTDSARAADTTMDNVPGDRSDLDEALFASEMSFSANGAPNVSAEVAETLQAPEPVSYQTTSAPCGPGLSVIRYGLTVETNLPPGISYHTPDAEPDFASRTVVEGGGYELANLCPGVFEVRQVAPPPAEWPAPPLEEPETPESALPPELPQTEDLPLPAPVAPPLPPEPVAAAPAEESREEVSLGPLPPRPAPVLEVNTGLTLAPGETAPITPEHFRLSGGEPCLLDVMVLSPPVHGAIVREGFALTGGDVFTQEDIDQNRIAYRHDGGKDEQDSFTFATPEGEVSATVFAITIAPTRSAPELTGNGQLTLAPLGCRVTEILAGTARCCEPDLHAGMAIIGVAGRGQWHYSLNGVDWYDLAEVQPAGALLLRDRDHLRFTPRPGSSGTVKLTYHAWDQSTGQAGAAVDLSSAEAVGGATAFSKSPACATTVIAPPVREVNHRVTPWSDAPTLAEAMGGPLAVVRVVGPGTWQYSLDDGRTWNDFTSVYHGRARLLGAEDRVRFLPRPGASGKVILSGRPWDGDGVTGETISLAARRSYGEGTPFGDAVQTRTWHLHGS